MEQISGSFALKSRQQPNDFQAPNMVYDARFHPRALEIILSFALRYSLGIMV